jgi:hypothetical protein
MTSSGIELAIFQLAAKCLSKLLHRVPERKTEVANKGLKKILPMS